MARLRAADAVVKVASLPLSLRRCGAKSSRPPSPTPDSMKGSSSTPKRHRGPPLPSGSEGNPSTSRPSTQRSNLESPSPGGSLSARPSSLPWAAARCPRRADPRRQGALAGSKLQGPGRARDRARPGTSAVSAPAPGARHRRPRGAGTASVSAPLWAPASPSLGLRAAAAWTRPCEIWGEGGWSRGRPAADSRCRRQQQEAGRRTSLRILHPRPPLLPSNLSRRRSTSATSR
jgi:hypothetical protein